MVRTIAGIAPHPLIKKMKHAKVKNYYFLENII